ncbi:hypothetical protein LINPERHAP2_LOCUS21761 [Linum perenne]
MRRRLEILWAKHGMIQVSDIANGFFLARFSNADDYNRAAFEGPWKMFDYYITVAKWSPDFNEEEPIKKILTWVRLPKLPIHFFNPVAVGRIGDYIGKTVRLDLATKDGSRARYARVCVEIDLSKPLLGKYVIEDRVLRVEYESLENLCYFCGVYGHKMDCCPSLAEDGTPSAQQAPPKVEKPSLDEDMKETAGEWMTVVRRHKKPQAKVAKTPSKPGGSGSRFTILQPDSPEPPPQRDNPPPPPPLEKVPKVVPSPLQGPGSGPSPFEMAASLSRVLGDNDQGQAPKNTPRPPLADVTNDQAGLIGKSGLKLKGTASHKMVSAPPNDDDQLVSIPIMFHNQAFETNVVMTSPNNQIPSRQKVGVKKGGKQSVKATSTAAPKKKVTSTRPIRAFGPKVGPSASDAPANGRPPDRSA